MGIRKCNGPSMPNPSPRSPVGISGTFQPTQLLIDGFGHAHRFRWIFFVILILGLLDLSHSLTARFALGTGTLQPSLVLIFLFFLFSDPRCQEQLWNLSVFSFFVLDFMSQRPFPPGVFSVLLFSFLVLSRLHVQMGDVQINRFQSTELVVIQAF